MVRMSLVLSILGWAAASAARSKEITSLPDVAQMPASRMVGGYVNVGASREVFYVLAESERDAARDPLVVWFQGGPGCSGLGGLFTETGPLVMEGHGQLRGNDFSWTKFANMVFLEQPVGVGFSYDTTKAADYTYPASDSQAASDNLAFLQGFLKEHPEFAGRELWFAGESYGGMYMPTLAQKLVHSDDAQLKSMFRGMLLGNAVMMCESAAQGNASLPLQFNRYFFDGLLPYSTYAAWTKQGCDGVAHMTGAARDACVDLFNAAQTAIGVINQELRSSATRRAGLLASAAAAAAGEPAGVRADLDPDNLYQDFCTGNGTLSPGYGDAATCETGTQALTRYLSRADVRAAIGATSPVAAWSVCSNLAYDSDLAVAGLVPVLTDLFRSAPHPLHVLYYSGDVDVATVPIAQTQACLFELGQAHVAGGEWQSWTVNGWHAGYAEVLTNYTFATVKGAGHEVPQYQPLTSFNMAQRFIERQNVSEVSPPVRTHAVQRMATPSSQGAALRLAVAAAQARAEARLAAQLDVVM